MARRKLGANVDQVVGAHAELDQLCLRLNAGSGKMAAHGLRRILDLRTAGTQLNCGITVLLFGAVGNYLAVLQPQYCYRDMLAGVVVDAGHSHLLCNHT